MFFADEINILLARKFSFSYSATDTASLMIKAILLTFSKQLYNVHLSVRVSRRDGNIFLAHENNELCLSTAKTKLIF